MAKVERIREALPVSLTQDYLKPRIEAGWRPVAVVWEREIESEEQKSGEPEEVPYGLKVADDCAHLEEHPTEKQALTLMIELIVADRPLAQVADELNRQGFRTRGGSKWGPAAVFNLMSSIEPAGAGPYEKGTLTDGSECGILTAAPSGGSRPHSHWCCRTRCQAWSQVPCAVQWLRPGVLSLADSDQESIYFARLGRGWR